MFFAEMEYRAHSNPTVLPKMGYHPHTHSRLHGLQGWLPPPPNLNVTILENTRDHVYAKWNFTYSYGWDFPVVAMNAVRMENAQTAMDFLLHPVYQFDDIGMPVGGSRVPTPYFPGASSLLFAIEMMAGGWDGSLGVHFPDGWVVGAEGFTPAM